MSAAVLAAKVVDMDIPSLIEDFQYHGTTQDDYGSWNFFREIPSPIPSPEEIIIFRESLGNVYSSMRTLPKNDVDVFMTKHFDNCKISEISNEYGVSRSRIYTSLKNTRKSIRQNLQNKGQLF